MTVQDEFRTVDLILASDAETRGVDAFALSLIKAEKQARRLLTYLVYQHAWCDRTTVAAMKQALESSTKVYFDGLLKGWDAVYPRSIKQLVGPRYAHLKTRLDDARTLRNKVFHGQLSGKGLGRLALCALVKDVREWCDTLGQNAESEVGYDGCGRNSFRKATDPAALCAKYKQLFADVSAYRAFIRKTLERRP